MEIHSVGTLLIIYTDVKMFDKRKFIQQSSYITVEFSLQN